MFTGTEVNKATQSTREGIMLEMAGVTVNVYMYYTVHTDDRDNWVFVNVASVHILFLYIYIKKRYPLSALQMHFWQKR